MRPVLSTLRPMILYASFHTTWEWKVYFPFLILLKFGNSVNRHKVGELAASSEKFSVEPDVPSQNMRYREVYSSVAWKAAEASWTGTVLSASSASSCCLLSIMDWDEYMFFFAQEVHWFLSPCDHASLHNNRVTQRTVLGVWQLSHAAKPTTYTSLWISVVFIKSAKVTQSALCVTLLQS